MRFLLFPVLLGFPVAANASGASIWWPAWTMTSTEELSFGVKYPLKWDAPRYPMMRLFDGDPKTAWVYNQAAWHPDSSGIAYEPPQPTDYGLKLQPSRPVVLDEVRLVNGQKRFSRTFYGQSSRQSGSYHALERENAPCLSSPAC